MYHMFHSDWVEGTVLGGESEESFNEEILDKTVVNTYCGINIPARSNDWTFQHEFTTCEDCKADYALSLLADLP